ncbi:hypothetical protein ACFV4N_43875 [Actinosynnema sp. NPDC059797]
MTGMGKREAQRSRRRAAIDALRPSATRRTVVPSWRTTPLNCADSPP